MNNKQKGLFAEQQTVDFLLNEGFDILSRNFRITDAEIDIIACKNDTINFIEVKKIPSNWDGVDISAKITKQKMLKIKKAASVYLAQHYENKYDVISFDVAVVTDNKVNVFYGAF